MILFLDDLRTPPELHPTTGLPVQWDVCRTAKEALERLALGTVTFISFDHDLGSQTFTGYSVAKWIEEEAFTNPKFTPPDYFIHSANSVGTKDIRMAMEAAHKFYDKRIGQDVNQIG